jgi:hypothetical protein
MARGLPDTLKGGHRTAAVVVDVGVKGRVWSAMARGLPDTLKGGHRTAAVFFWVLVVGCWNCTSADLAF